MWPMLLDMSREECRRILRRLELEAYSSAVSALRAQGDLTKEKRKLLQDLGTALNISTERHRAEIRRAVNDEKLATIAEHMAGPNTSTEWAIEGRRLIPLMPRLVPQTAFTALANNVANIAAAENAKLPPPSFTAKKGGEELSPAQPNIPEGSKTAQRASSPTPNMMMFPPGMSIQIKEEDEEKGRKRRRSSSLEPLVPAAARPPSPPAPPPPKMPTVTSPQPTTRTVTIPVGVTPMKITLTTTSTRTTTSTTNSTGTTQKVIIVSSTSSSGSPSILQRSLSVPIVKTVSATGSTSTLTQNRGTSLIINNSAQSSGGVNQQAGGSTIGNIVTISTGNPSAGNITATTVSIGGVPTTAYITSQGGIPKIRPKAIAQPAKPRPRTGSIVIPLTPHQQQSMSGSQGLANIPNVQGVHLKTSVQPGKPNLHIKQEGTSMKIMPISNVPGATKILPKPSFSSSSPSPVYVMTTTTANVSMVTRTVSSGTGPRVVTVSTGTLPRTTTTHIRPTSSTILSVNSKPLQTVHITPQSQTNIRPSMGKPNVIVVQKGSSLNRGVTLTQGGKEVMGKVLMGKPFSSSIQQPSVATVTVQKPSTSSPHLHSGNVQASSVAQTLNLPMSSTQGNVIVLDLSQEQLSKNTVLTEILQASGILGESITVSENDNSSSDGQAKSNFSSNEWIQMDTEEKQQSQAPVEVASSTPSEPVTVEEQGERATTTASETTQQQPAQIALREVMLPIDLDEGQVVTLEEAVELLGQSNSEEAKALLKQAGIEVTETLSSSEQAQDTSSNQGTSDSSVTHVVQQGEVSTEPLIVTSHAPVVQATEVPRSTVKMSSSRVIELIGELDPQTGVYSIQSSGSSKGQEQKVEIEDDSKTVVTEVTSAPSASSLDIFSTALASAEINLDTFQYVDEEMGSGRLSQQQSRSTEVSSIAQTSVTSEQTKVAFSTASTIKTVVLGSVPKEVTPAEESVPKIDSKEEEVKEEHAVIPAYLKPESATECTAVTVEPSHMDTTTMHIEDFTSQKVEGQDIT